MENWQRPDRSLLLSAMQTYLKLAYPSGAPTSVRTRVETLAATPIETLYESKLFERTPPEMPTRLSLRLGNSFYPHMKLVIERAPHGNETLFRADTHDRHIRPPAGSPEAAAFNALIAKNAELSARIEAAWEEQGLMTFKVFLRNDLLRRRKESLPVADIRAQ